MTHVQKVDARFHAAKVNGGAAAAEPRGNGLFTVTGRAGARYSVRAWSLDHITCDCRAGQFGNPCWHAAAAFLRHIADSMAVPA